jgi:hypothetical protein
MLKLATKGAVRFEWSDGIEETTVTLNPGDDEATLKRKLERILSLSRPDLPERLPGFALGMAQTAHPAPEDPDAPVPYTPVQGNGWAPYAGAGLPHPDLPERLKDTVELIPPEEQG